MNREFELGFDEKLLGSKPFTMPCPPPTAGGGNPNAPYNLPGPQVEYNAAFWLINAKLRIPTLPKLKTRWDLPRPIHATRTN